MRLVKLAFLSLVIITAISACNKELNVNADWKDITVVYGLLDQSRDTTFIKITKAFLGPGDALQFAKISDSSNYPSKLEVKMFCYLDNVLKDSILCDTITIHDKLPYDDSVSFFYYPNQLMYYTTAKLNQNYTYELRIKNRSTGKIVSAQTNLVHDFEIRRPQAQASFPPGQSFEVVWTPANYGKRYQLMIRFYYNEYLKSNPHIFSTKYIDWIVFNDIKSIDVNTIQPFDLYFPSDGFYNAVGTKIDTNSQVTRAALYCDYKFSVAASDMNTYMEVTEPSQSLVQEKPAYTNIINGIGIFSSRFNKKQGDTLRVSQLTKDELKVNSHTKDLGF